METGNNKQINDSFFSLSFYIFVFVHLPPSSVFPEWSLHVNRIVFSLKSFDSTTQYVTLSVVCIKALSTTHDSMCNMHSDRSNDNSKTPIKTILIHKKCVIWGKSSDSNKNNNLELCEWNAEKLYIQWILWKYLSIIWGQMIFFLVLLLSN